MGCIVGACECRQALAHRAVGLMLPCVRTGCVVPRAGMQEALAYRSATARLGQQPAVMMCIQVGTYPPMVMEVISHVVCGLGRIAKQLGYVSVHISEFCYI